MKRTPQAAVNLLPDTFANVFKIRRVNQPSLPVIILLRMPWHKHLSIQDSAITLTFFLTIRLLLDNRTMFL